MPSLAHHRCLSTNTLTLLPIADLAPFGDSLEYLQQEACGIPDQFYGSRAKIEPYLCFTDGEPFHYPPNEPIEYNNWRVEVVAGKSRLIPLPYSDNAFYNHCRNAFSFYFERIAQAVSNRQHHKAASLVGAIWHVLQDNTLPCHGLEGLEGVDILLFSRLARPPAAEPDWDATLSLGEMGLHALSDGGYQPQLLGCSTAEAAFNAYSRFCDAIRENRWRFLPLLRAHQEHAPEERERLEHELFRTTARLCADFLHTALRLEDRRFDPAQRAVLNRRDLTCMTPVHRPFYLSPPYRFTPWRVGYALTAARAQWPLRLIDAANVISTHERGFGLGCHKSVVFEYDLPAAIYRWFTATIGPHAELGTEARLKVSVSLANRVLWSQQFGPSIAAAPVRVDVQAGGPFRIEAEALTERPLDPVNQWVIAEPLLHK